jgi:hypothetical protein
MRQATAWACAFTFACRVTRDRKQGSTIDLAFWRAPERLFDEPDELVEWVRLAPAGARRVAATRDRRRQGEDQGLNDERGMRRPLMPGRYPPRGRDGHAARQAGAYFDFDFDFGALLPDAVAEDKSNLETFVPLSDTPAIKPALP